MDVEYAATIDGRRDEAAQYAADVASELIDAAVQEG